MDILEKTEGEIEILPILDGYIPPDEELVADPRVKYIRLPQSIGMRNAINLGVEKAVGEYLMKFDAHCVMERGIDLKLAADCADNMVMIPRRYQLDDEKWAPNFEEPPIDYEYIMFPAKFQPWSLRGFKWRERIAERKDMLIDDTLVFQGSCWFMSKYWWQTAIRELDSKSYGQMGQESTEITMKTFVAGGRTVVNKKTWYAHLRKTKKYGGTHLGLHGRKECYKYSYNHWANEHKDEFIKLIEKFWPIPGWPDNWKERLWPDAH